MLKWLSEFFVFARNYVVFTLLVSLSLFLISANNNSQVRGLQVVGLVTTSYLESCVKGLIGYFKLASANKRLEEQNGKLIDWVSRTRRAISENIQLRELLKMKEQSGNPTIPADVVGRSVEGGRNYVTIDAGTSDGVRNGDPVVAGSGLVGVILLAGENYSIVRTVLDNESRISARLVSASADGIVSAGENGLLSMNDVSRRFDVKPGDMVETSTLSSVVPPDIVIGVVANVSSEQGNIFKRIRVQPSVDFSSLSVVFVMQYRPPGEATELRSKILKGNR